MALNLVIAVILKACAVDVLGAESMELWLNEIGSEILTVTIITCV